MADTKRVTEPLEFHEPMRYYRVVSQFKQTNVFPNGYGLIRFQTRIQVTDPNFSGPVHYFAFSNSVSNALSLPPVKEVGQGTVLDVGRRSFVNYRLLHPSTKRLGMKPTELQSQSTERMRVFQFQLNPHCYVGQEIEYAWEWGQPHLFDTMPGSKEDSSYKCVVPTDELQMQLRFYYSAGGKSVSFDEEPVLSYKSVRTGQKVLLGARGMDSLDYCAFNWVVGRPSPEDQFILSWKNSKKPTT